jgi:lysylphosphatidylglycerol synthetase-like protein (DUF2156 family)
MRHSSIPAFLWYAPAMTGLSYLLVFILFIVLPKNPANEQLGDIIFSIGQVCIVLSMLLLHKINLNGHGFWKKFSLFLPALGSLSYLAGIISLLTGKPIILFFPLGALLIGLGMLIVGIQVARAGTLKQWKRFTPLLVGLYPFVVMFPIVIITGSPSIIAIMLWGIPWKIMGCTLLSELYGWKRSIGRPV